MLSQELTNIDWIKSKIQSRIGTFLLLKEKLLKIKSTSLDLNVQAKAEALLERQKSLEEDLSKAQKIIEQINLGVYSLSDIVFLGTTYYEMEKQISDVEDLEQEYISGPKQEVKMTGFEFLILSLIGGGIIYGLFAGKK